MVIDDLEALDFGDWAPYAPQPAGDALSLPSAPANPISAPTSLAIVAVSTLAPVISPSAGNQKRSADISGEKGQPEKRPRIKASPSSLAVPSASAATPQPPRPALWRLDFEVDIGRPLNMEGRVTSSPYVVAALGRVCAVPRDME